MIGAMRFNGAGKGASDRIGGAESSRGETGFGAFAPKTDLASLGRGECAAPVLAVPLRPAPEPEPEPGVGRVLVLVLVLCDVCRDEGVEEGDDADDDGEAGDAIRMVRPPEVPSVEGATLRTIGWTIFVTPTVADGDCAVTFSVTGDCGGIPGSGRGSGLTSVGGAADDGEEEEEAGDEGRGAAAEEEEEEEEEEGGSGAGGSKEGSGITRRGKGGGDRAGEGEEEGAADDADADAD